MTPALIAIVGAGRMGRGMAHAFAYAGHEVRLLDFKDRATPSDAAEEVARGLRLMAELGATAPALAEAMIARVRVVSGTGCETALAEAGFVFEAVPEVMDIKAAAFARICAAVGEGVTIASTTSTFMVDDMAGSVASPARFLNTHWLNPAFLIPLVEVSPGSATSPAVLEGAMALLRGAGKVPVECRSAPGFIVPRIQALAMNEAARIVSEGVASVDAVDTATRVGFGLRFAVLGLLEFVDYGGGDILHYASAYLARSFGDERYAAPPIIGANMAAGRTGMRAGAGFHDWAGRDVAAYQRETLRKLVDLLAHLGLLPVGR